MNTLFLLAAHNTVVALVFALVVFGLTRVWRNPPVAHVLWLLVLLRLVAPPVVQVGWTALWLPESTPARDQIIADVTRAERQEAGSHPRFVDRPTARTAARASAASETKHGFAAEIGLIWNRGRPVLFWFWFGGAVLCALVAAMRIVRFERYLRGTLPASERLQRLAIDTARKLGVGRVPDLRYMDGTEVPFVWCAGRRPTIVLPLRLGCQLDDQQLGPHSGSRACPFAATRPLGARRGDDRFDRVLVEPAGLGDSAADSPSRGPLLRRVGPPGISRVRETLRRGRAKSCRVAEPVAGRRTAAAGQSVATVPFSESED